MINSGKKRAVEIVRQLLLCKGVELTIVVGRDEKLKAQVEAATRNSPIPVRVFGWRNDLPELLAETHLLISKSGGSTAQAALAARCPFLISQVAPGQEEGVAQFIVENDCGAIAENPQEIGRMVNQIFADDGALWHKWHAGVSRISRPDAVFEIARFILGNSSQVTD